MLAADTQGSAVLHQADVVDIGHLGAAHTLVDPAHDIAQNALRIVVELLLALGCAPVWRGGDRNAQQPVEQGIALFAGLGFFQGLLHIGHQHLVVVQRVQRGARGAGHPGGVGAGTRMGNFLLHHGLHQVGHSPHALANLRPATQTTTQADQHIAALIGLDPGAGLHVALADHGASPHGAVHLVAGAVQKAGVDEGHAAGSSGNAGLEVEAGAPLLVHDAKFDGAVRQAQHVFDPAKQFGGKGHLGRAMHLGFDNVD